MKVLMLNYEFPPVGGGTANANKYLLREMDKIGVEVDLVTSSPGEYVEEDFSGNITIYRMDVGKGELSYWRIAELTRYIVKGTVKSVKLNRENDYDLVHAWTGFPCGLMAKFIGEDYIVALRGSDVPGYSKRFKSTYLFLKPLIKNIWISAEEIIPNSEDLKELAQKTLDTDMSVIENGVDTEEFYPDFKTEENIKIITVARLVDRKRFEDVIRAVKELPVKLEVVGDGPEMQRLKDLADDFGIRDKVDFAGRVEHENISSYYRAADVFVLPSLNEGMSNTVLEAMASGLPLIITGTGGAEKLVDGNGFVVEKKSPENIKTALEAYLEDRDRIRQDGKRSRDLAEQRSWKRIAERYFKVYREVVSHG